MQKGPKYFLIEFPTFFSHNIQYNESIFLNTRMLLLNLNKMYENFSLSNYLHFLFTLTCTFLLAFREKPRNRLPIFSFNLLMISFLLFIPGPALFFLLYYWAVHILWGRVISLFNFCFIILNKPKFHMIGLFFPYLS